MVAGGLLIIYFLPAVIAGVRRHGKEGSLIFLNLIAGWLLIPWVFLFVWAVVGETKSAEFVQ